MKRFEVTRITTTVVEAKDAETAIWGARSNLFPPDTDEAEAVCIGEAEEEEPEYDDMPEEHFDDVMADRIAARNE